MPPFHIRPATPADIDAIADFNVRLALETESLTLNPATVRSGVARGLSRATYFVAQAASDVIGQLMLTTEWSDWRDAELWWLQSVYVRPDWRRRGVFTALLAHATAQAHAQNVPCLRLYVEAHNAPAQATYLHHAFHHAGYQVMERTLRVP